MYRGQEELDNLVWDRNDAEVVKYQDRLRLEKTCRLVEEFVERTFGKPAAVISPLVFGGFNLLYQVRIGDMEQDVVVRVPVPSLDVFPEERIAYEAATAALVARETILTLPKQISYGIDEEIGPHITLDRVEFDNTMSERLTRRNKNPQAPHVLDSSVLVSTLEIIWGQTADCLIEIARLRFPRIGSLRETLNDTFEVAGRPLTHNMNDMIRLANIPPSVLPSTTRTYATAEKWYTALAEMHIAQLVFQHNDLVMSKDDCRNKYVARQLFRRLAKDGRLSSFGFAEDNWSSQALSGGIEATCPAPNGSGAFRLWGDDFRGGNILLDSSDKITALVDWEHTYVAPTQFVLDPPWWLLIETPEMWSSGTEDWIATYEKRLETWLISMHRAETESLGPAPFAKPMSTYMRESWSTGRFWLSYGARKSWAFDMVFWRYLDERFFGARTEGVPDEGLWRTRVHLLTEEERDAMEPFVAKKMGEMKERKIVHWEESDARQRLEDLLFE